MSRYAISRKLDCGYDEAVVKARAAFENEGFGIVSEVHVTELLREKLGKDFRKYIIFGACSPETAYKALTIENDIGLMLPCNVIVYENDEGGSTVASIDPVISLSMVENPALGLVAKEIRERVERAISSAH